MRPLRTLKKDRVFSGTPAAKEGYLERILQNLEGIQVVERSEGRVPKYAGLHAASVWIGLAGTAFARTRPRPARAS